MTILYRNSIIGFLLLISLSWLVGCTPIRPGRRDGGRDTERIGTLRVIGANVFHNEHRASDGEEVYAGDTINTGPASNAIVELVGGGFVQLDENTDPEFSFKVVSEDRGRRCIHLSIKFGQVWVDRKLVCFDTPDGAGIIQSQVNIEVARAATTITIFRGGVQITRPAEQFFKAREQVMLAKGVIGPVRTLNDDQLLEVRRWLSAFEVTPSRHGWCCGRRGTVYPAAEAECRSEGARFFDTERKARQFCEAAEPRGWCCGKDRKIFPGTEAECRSVGAIFYMSELEAQKYCRTSESVGWCCAYGKLFEANRKRCFNTDFRRALTVILG
jgi:hypothetical protein